MKTEELMEILTLLPPSSPTTALTIHKKLFMTSVWSHLLLRNIASVTKSQTQLTNFTFIFHFHALEKEMTTHSSILAWRISVAEEPVGLPSVGWHRIGHD